MLKSVALMHTALCSASFYNTDDVPPVAVSFEHPRYYVNESSGLLNITIVTSDSPRSSFIVKVSVVLGRHRTAGGYGKTKCGLYGVILCGC